MKDFLLKHLKWDTYEAIYKLTEAEGDHLWHLLGYREDSEWNFDAKIGIWKEENKMNQDKINEIIYNILAELINSANNYSSKREGLMQKLYDSLGTSVKNE